MSITAIDCSRVIVVSEAPPQDRPRSAPCLADKTLITGRGVEHQQSDGSDRGAAFDLGFRVEQTDLPKIVIPLQTTMAASATARPAGSIGASGLSRLADRRRWMEDRGSPRLPLPFMPCSPLFEAVVLRTARLAQTLRRREVAPARF